MQVFLWHMKAYSKFHSLVSATLQRGDCRAQVCAPVGKEFFRPQRSHRIIASIANTIVFTHIHQSIVHVQGILQTVHNGLQLVL